MNKNRLLIVLRGLAGGVVGGAIGSLLFGWLIRHGLYGIIIPGAFIGLGAGLAARGKSVLLGALCCAAAITLMILLEWKYFDLTANETLGYLLTHLHQKSPAKLLMMAVGAAFAFWFGQSR